MKKVLGWAGALCGLVAVVACSSTTNVVPAPAVDAGDGDAGITDGGGTMCSSARDQLLVPSKVSSSAVVSVLSDTGGVKTIYVDASAGGEAGAATNPRVYVDLATGTRVDHSDVAAVSATDWDLALKRYVIYSNSGDGGAGAGGAVQLSESFASVTTAEIKGATPAAESFFDGDCNPQLDALNGPQTTFSSWYNYDLAINKVTPNPGVSYVVRGGTGHLYKVGITSYDALPDGGSRNYVATGFFILEVSEVTP